jgi:hypothetical protein
MLSEPEILVEHRMGAMFRLGGNMVGQQPTASVTVKTDTPLRPRNPGQPSGPERIRQQHGQVEPLPPKLPHEGKPAVFRASAAGFVQDQPIDQLKAGEHVGHIGPGDGDEFRLCERLPECPQGRRSHNSVTNPIGQKDGGFHDSVVVIGMLDLIRISRFGFPNVRKWSIYCFGNPKQLFVPRFPPTPSPPVATRRWFSSVC